MFPVGQGKYENLVTEDDHSHTDPNVRVSTAYSKRGAWDHIQNLDQFFSDIYKYHQCGGFTVILLTQILWLIKFAFVIFITIELSVCTRWSYLTNSSLSVENWTDVFQPPNQCWASLPFSASLLVVGAVITILVQITFVGIQLSRFWEIRRFCTNILDMPTSDVGLSDLTWSEVQQRLLQSQRDFQFCVYKVNLDELDIYNRILRHKNYLIAMINQDIIPIRFRMSSNILPQIVYLPDGYLFNLKLILFWTPWSPFHNYWQLRADYKWVTKRHELAVELAARVRILGFINILMAPVIFIAQLVAFICANAERFRYQPSTLFGRRWSNYARLYLRHFNELQHEFGTRLKQAYIPASRYLDSFVSQPLTVLAETGAFIFGGASVAFFTAGLIREQMMHLPGYLAILVGGGLLARSCLSLIPDENMVYCPRNLLVSTLMRIHYMPDHWKEQAGTYQVRSEFSQLFQYRMVGLLEELLSPIITPLILIFVLPNHTLEIVDFLRNYTVEVPGVGDVCSFAQLDIRRHGDPMWQPNVESSSDDQSATDNDEHTSEVHSCSKKMTKHSKRVAKATPTYDQSTVTPNRQNDTTVEGNYASSIHHSAAGGKIELSLMHFHLTNPSWKLPPDGLAYLKSVRNQALLDLQQQQQLAQFQDNYKNDIQADGTTSQPTPGMFSTLYGAQTSMMTSIYQSTHQQLSNACTESSSLLKNVSHLPGSGLRSENTYGVVGAMVESMRSSGTQPMHRSDPNVAESQTLEPVLGKTPRGDCDTHKLPTCVSNSATKLASQTNAAPLKSNSELTGSQLSPAVFHCSMLDGPTPITMSLMAASALHSADTLGLPFYQPYNSQIEDGLSQHTGFNNSLIGSVGGRRCAITEVLTADMSVSALYIHELFHRRRQQRQHHDSSRGYSSQRGMAGSTPGVVAGDDVTFNSTQFPISSGIGVFPTSGYLPGYQLPHTSFAPITSTGNLVSLSGARSNMERGTFAASSEPGIIRTPSDGRRIPSAHFSEVAEEDDENIGTPRQRIDINFSAYLPGNESHIIRHPSGQTNTGGIITLSGSRQ
ncbi:unnamed protein product [Heterobilharzia americana]|nr:unnamed protein product [Heterobilharzia americana]